VSSRSKTTWYDPAINQFQIASKTKNFNEDSILCSVKDQFVFNMCDESRSVVMSDISLQSPCWVRKPDLLVRRPSFRVCVLNDYIYAVCCIYILPTYFML